MHIRSPATLLVAPCLYWVWSLFAFRTALILHCISTGFWKHSLKIFVHIDMTASHCPQHINDVNLPSHHISEGSCHHDSRTEFEIILAVQHGTQINPFACFAEPRVQNPKISNEITFVKKGRIPTDCPIFSFPINSLVDKVVTHPPKKICFL